jgi:Ca2+-transporting ATPase
MEPYKMAVADVLAQLRSSPRGLSRPEAAARLRRFGYNQLTERWRPGLGGIFLRQFKSALIAILLVAGIVCAAFGMLRDAAVIFVIVALNAALGFIQEFRAERAMAALRELMAPRCHVMRDGDVIKIPAREVVPGDIVLLEEGARVPGDCRLLEAIGLRCDESLLTGESTPVNKITEPLREVPVAERANMAFMGTAVVAGRGMGVVTATGMATEMGKIAELVQAPEKPTPLQTRLGVIGRWMGLLALSICAVISIFGLLQGLEIFTVFLTAVSLAVAAVPEGLPVILTIALALGVERMAKRRAIVSKVSAVEALGSTTVICADKTGTMTTNEMTVRRLWAGRDISVSGIGFEPFGDFRCDGKIISLTEHLKMLLKAGALCNNARLVKMPGWRIIGDPTEGALLVAAAKAGIERQGTRLAEIPFSSERKRMTVIHVEDDRPIAWTKGAPETILELCDYIYIRGRPRRLTKAKKDKIAKITRAYAAKGLRVLALAYRPLRPAKAYTEQIEKKLIFLGLAGMIDPPRPETKAAIAECARAGIRTVMITGDHVLTATAIARELGLASRGLILTGAQLDKMSDGQLDRAVDKATVYARVTPEHKVRILAALKRKGEIVAMTGDGVNDAPSLKYADIGIAMGIRGTDVAKEASSMILADDNFATIVAAVREGRGIYDNIRKFLRFILSTNFTEILTVSMAMAVMLPLPLLPLQILWINLVTATLPALMLSVDPVEPDIMRKKPRSPKAGLLSGMILFILASACVCLVMALAGFGWTLITTGNLAKAQTIVFTVIVMFELLFIFNCRSEKKSVLETGPFVNRYLLLAVFLAAGLQLAVIYIPALQQMFGTMALGLADWGLIALLAAPALALSPRRLLA